MLGSPGTQIPHGFPIPLYKATGASAALGRCTPAHPPWGEKPLIGMSDGVGTAPVPAHLTHFPSLTPERSPTISVPQFPQCWGRRSHRGLRHHPLGPARLQPGAGFLPAGRTRFHNDFLLQTYFDKNKVKAAKLWWSTNLLLSPSPFLLPEEGEERRKAFHLEGQDFLPSFPFPR